MNGRSDQRASLRGITSPTVLCSHCAFGGISDLTQQYTQAKFTNNNMSNDSSKDVGQGAYSSSLGAWCSLSRASAYLPIMGLTVVSSLLPSQVYNVQKSHFHVATRI